MSYWINSIQFALVGAMLLLALLGLALAVIMPGMDRWNKRFFVLSFVILALLAGSCFVDLIAYGDPTMILVERVVSYVESLLPIILMLMLAIYLLHYCGEDYRKSALFRAVLVLSVVYFIALTVAQFTPLFFYYTPENLLYLGPLYAPTIGLLAAALILILTGAIRRRNKLSRRLYRAFLIFLTPLTVALIVHMFVPVFMLVALGVVMMGLSMFVAIVSEQIEQYMRLQQEAAHQRTRIMMLQMRPHFIHNTMTSIYYLCEQDPKTAQQVTMDFNTYLRKNFNAIVKDETIPFDEELEHTRAYLAVEQAQFANKLVVDYDTPHTQFHMPPLTLQPLAENAVKHGMSPQTIPLHITIRTRETEFGSEVVVEDNGPGFDSAEIDKPHTTLANIRQRLETMCNGTLDITSREGGGTMVKVTIP